MVYPEILLDVDDAVSKMKTLSFLDAQTKSVSVASLVYTQDLEFFTSVIITFEWSSSGLLKSSYKLVTVPHMEEETERSFLNAIIAPYFTQGKRYVAGMQGLNFRGLVLGRIDDES